MIKKYFRVLGDLSSVNRYSQSFLTKPENVLEHTGFVALLANLIGSKIPEINMGELLSRAVLHDIDEIFTGDLPHPVKYHNDKLHKQINKLECENMAYICNYLDYKDAYNHWYNAKDKTLEGFIIKICDTAAVLYKIEHEYYILGNKTILGHCKDMYHRLNSFKENNFYFEQAVLNNIINDLIVLQIKMYGDYNEN